MFKKIFSGLLAVVLLCSSIHLPIFPQEKMTVSAEDKKKVKIPRTVEKVRELEELRESNSKTYINSDGTYTTDIFTEDIHYEENGELKTISNTPQENNEADKHEFKYKNKDNRFSVKFAANSKKKNLVSLKIGTEKINFALLHANQVDAKREEGLIVYEDIFKNTDIQYSLGSSSVKEDIILKDRDSARSFEFFITGSLIPKKEERNIHFYNKKNELVWIMPHPFMEDQNGKYSEDIAFSIEKYKQGYILALKPDSEYLDEKDTVYPVRIDPTVNLGGSNTNTFDTYVMSKYPGYNYYTTPELRTGYTTSTGVTRSYLNFSQAMPNLSGKLLVKADLNVYKWADSGTVISTNVYANRIASAWDNKTVTYGSQPSINTTVSYGATSATGTAGWRSLNVTDLVDGWMKGTFPNYGVVLRSTSEGTSGTYRKFNASESSSNKPYLSITYSERPAAPTATAYSNSDGTGYVNLSWPKVDGATGYKVLIFNGRVYEEFDAGNVTSWSTRGRKIWPTRAQIDSKQYNLRKAGDGRELPENPNDLYKRGGGNYPNSTNYWFRVKAYNKYGTTSQSDAAMPTIPDKTKPTVPGGVQITNDRIDSFTMGWQPSQDLDGSGVAKYRIFLGDQPGTANLVNGTETTSLYYTYPGTLEARKTYYAWIQAVDRSGNISNSSVYANKVARKEFDAQIVHYYVPATSNIDNDAGENLWFDVQNTGTASWTNDLNISLSITSTPPDGSPAVGYVGYLNTGEVIKPGESKRFYVNWKAKKGVIGSYGIKAVVGKGTTPTYINPPENMVDTSVLVKDTTPPSGNISINGDARYTTDRNVILKVYDVFDNANGEKYAQFANGLEGATADQLSFSESQLIPQSSATFNWALDDREGVHYVYSRFSDKSGNQSALYFDTIIYDHTLPKIELSNLQNGDYVSGNKKIEGTVSDDREKVTYKIEYNKKSNETVDWKLISSGTAQVINGVLAEWDTSSLPTGEYDIRISATDEAGQTNLETRTVWVDTLEKEWIGAEEYYPSYSIDLLDGSAFVNLYNGSLNIQDSDFSLPARGFSLNFARAYSSNQPEKGMLGKGWVSAFEEKLEAHSNYVDYHENDGSIHRFNKLDNGQYSIPAGTAYHLSYSETSGYELTQKNGSLITKVFSQNGQLQKVIDTNGNTIQFSYEASLLKKVSSLGKTILLQYNADHTLMEAVFSTGDKLGFTYKDEYLTDVKQFTKSGQISRHVHYDYKGGKLQAVVSENGLKVEFSYNGNRLVETKTLRSTRVIDAAKKYPLTTYDSIIETFYYDLSANKIFVSAHSINQNKTSKNLSNTDIELNADGNAVKENQIRTYLENEDPNDAKQDTNNITITKEYENHRLKSVTDALGNKTTNIYDAYGNLLEQILPAVEAGDSLKTYTIKNKYNDRGQIVQTTNTLGQTKEWKFDSKGNAVEIIDEEGNRQFYEYDSNGNVIKSKSDRGPLYGYLPDYSMEEKDLVNWKVQGTVKKTTSHAKSGKQSIEMAAGSSVQSEKVAIKKGRLPVQAFVEALATGTTVLELKLQFLKDDTIVKEYVQTHSPAASWKKFKADGAVPADATHVRAVITNKGSSMLYTDDLVLEETNLETGYVYDASGENVIEVADPYGSKTKYTYNEYGQPLTEVNALNQTKSIVYDEEQRVKQSKDRAGRMTQFQYDNMGNVIKEINSLGQETLYEYNEWGQLLYTKLPSVRMTYYKDEAVDKTEEKQAHFYIEYDELGRKIKETDENENIHVQEYDGYGRLARTIDPMQNQKYFSYDKNGNIITTIDYAAKNTDDGQDKVLIAKGEMHATYDKWNRQLTETDNTGNRNVLTMINTYDSENHLIHTKDAEGTEFHYTFNAAGENVYTKDNSNPSVETWTYFDGLGNAAITLSGNIAEYSVTDANGNVIQTVDHKGTKTIFEYNEAGDKIKQTNPDGSTTEWTYNQEGQVLTESQKAEDTADSTTYLVTRYAYNDAGEAVKQILEAKVYDKNTKQTVTSTIKDTELTYDELGRLIREFSKFYEDDSSTYKKSDTRFLYDLNGNLIRKWIYDESSKTIVNHGATTYPFVRSESAYEYDANNRFTREEKLENNVVTVKTYKDDENAEGIQSALGTTTVYYNENDLASRIVTPLSEQYLFTYTVSELKDTIKGPRLTIDMDYGLNEKMTSIQAKKKDTTQVLFSETYTYNGEEQIAAATNQWDGQKAYSYTAEGFLKTVTKGAETLTYSYDISGNLLKATDQTGKVMLENTYGQGNRIATSIQYNPGTQKYQKITYSFRADGSLQQESYHLPADTIDVAKGTKIDTVKLYDYASINLLLSITTKKGDQIIEKIEFTYDSEDNRTSKKVTNSSGERMEFYYYDANGDLVSISQKTGIDPVQNLMNIYRDADGQLLSFEYKGQIYDYVYNQRGDIVAITNGLREIVARYTYDEWGNLAKVTPLSELGKEVAKANPFRYVGKFGVQYDEDTKLYFMGWRDYDPKIGRYLVADEYEGEDNNPVSFNRYLYAESDPVNNIDPDGYAPKWLKKLAKGVKKASKAAYNFAIGDDIATLRSKNTKWYQKAGAALSIASNFIPGGGVVSKLAKAAVKGTSKAVKTYKASTVVKKSTKVIKAPAKKVAAKV
ncbi:MAG TPA: DNRLRE domain-containing protein, partial [Bacillaceae bacterium]